MSGPRTVTLLLLTLLGIGLLTAPSLAASGYALSADPAMDTPTETVTYQDTEYTISSITQVTPDQTVTVASDVPNNLGHYINFRGPDNQIISSERKVGDSSHTIDYYGPAQAGTYAITIQDNGTTQAVHPVVIPGYDVSVSAPDTVTSEEAVTIEATVAERDIERHSSLKYLKVVVGTDDGVAAQARMEQSGGNTYSTTMPASELGTGDYDIYVAVRGDEQVRQRDELLAVSETASLSVEDGGTTAPTETTTSTSNTGPDGSSGGGETSTRTQTPVRTQSTVTTDSTPTTERPTTAVGTRSQTSPTQSSPTTESTTDSNVIDPSTVTTGSTTTAASTTGDAGPGFTVAGALISIIATLYLQRRR